MINSQSVHPGAVRSAGVPPGVPPASSPSVSLDEGPGGETPPALAAEDGCRGRPRYNRQHSDAPILNHRTTPSKI